MCIFIDPDIMKLVWFFIAILVAIAHQSEELEVTECEYLNEKRTYLCKNIYSIFPQIFYGNYYLKCEKCDIKSFTDKTFPYENSLISFNVSNSGIIKLGRKSFSNLKSAQYLYLEHNRINQIAIEAFAGLRQVYELHLEHNLLEHLIPGFLADFETNSVALHHNKIVDLREKVFDGVLSLMTLDLQHNKIGNLHPDAFYGLHSLEFLELHNNNLCHIPLGVFKHLRVLRHLNLANNKLTSFAIGAFSGLRNLHSIILANNSIAMFDGDILLPFQHLSELDVGGNGIYYLDADQIKKNAPSLRTIKMDDNLFSCSLLKFVMQIFKGASIQVANNQPRFDVQNINGIACIQSIVTEPVSFKYILQTAYEEGKKSHKYC